MISEQKQDKIAGKVAGGIIKVQTRLSDRMNKFRYLKGMLICFCILSSSLSGYFLIGAFASKPKQKIRIDRIDAPSSVTAPREELYDEKIPDEIYYQIQDYKRYADSVGETIRLGLADSMRILEEIYLQQQKK